MKHKEVQKHACTLVYLISISERLRLQILEIDELTIGISLSTDMLPTTERMVRLNSGII
jgi:hypothetical protein